MWSFSKKFCTARSYADKQIAGKYLTSSNIDDRPHWYIYNYFNGVFVLRENDRLDKRDTNSVLLNYILVKASNGKETEEYREILTSRLNMYRVNISKLKRRGFNYDSISHLFYTNKKKQRIITI